MADQPLICARNITKTFPGVKALDGVDFDLYPGEVHVLIGENGAGKSTLMKIFAGAYQPDSGTLIVQGKEARIHNPRHAHDLGISIIYQEYNLVPYLNVAHNIFLGRAPRRKSPPFLIDHAKMHADSQALLSSLNTDIDTHAKVKFLGIAQQQMVEVARAVSIDAKIIIMDEPTAALTKREIDQLFSLIELLKSKGMGIIYISHRLNEVHQVGDRVTVLRDGRYIDTRPVSGVTVDELISMMVGRSIGNMFPRHFAEPGEVALEIENLSNHEKSLRDINLTVRRGEIVGLAGLVGSGRTDLAKIIFGATPYDGGQLKVFGKPVKDATPSTMVHRGVGFLPEDRKNEGLALILSVAENVVMASLERLFPRSVIDGKKESSVVRKAISDLSIATPTTKREVRYLSGGNQQKVVLAKWLTTNSNLLIFDEPTRGIDVGAKAEVHDLMDQLVNNGAAVLMVSSELPEILGMSDRIYVMCEGRIVAEIPREQATQERILAHMMGHGDGKNGSNN
jgi:ribose transport system ATP-binding protein